MQSQTPEQAGSGLNPRIHIVQPGENLSNIAKTYYGDEQEAHWITLYNFNREIIGENPDLIQVGMALIIPELGEFLYPPGN